MLVRLSNSGKTFVAHIVRNVSITEGVPLEEAAGPAAIVTQLLVWSNILAGDHIQLAHTETKQLTAQVLFIPRTCA